MFTFSNVREMAFYRIDEEIEDVDIIVLNVINNAINQAYMLLSSTVDQRVEDITVPFNRRISLPNDIIDIENVSHSTIGDLSQTDYERKANVLYVRSKDINGGTVTITYTKYPKPLVNDDDIVELNHGYVYALAAYAAYIYQLHRRKYSSAQLLLAEFNSIQGNTHQFLEINEGESE